MCPVPEELQADTLVKLYRKYENFLFHSRLQSKVELPETQQSLRKCWADLCQQALHVFIIYRELEPSTAMSTRYSALCKQEAAPKMYGLTAAKELKNQHKTHWDAGQRFGWESAME